MHLNRFRLGRAPEPAWTAYGAPPDTSWNKGELLLREEEECREGMMRGREGKGRGMEWRDPAFLQIFLIIDCDTLSTFEMVPPLFEQRS